MREIKLKDMFNKKKKECLNSIKSLEYDTELLHHSFIKEIKTGYIINDREFYINNKEIGSISESCISDVNYFQFNNDLSQELKDELRPIILKWVEDSNEYYDTKNKIENDKMNLEIKESNEELLKYIIIMREIKFRVWDEDNKGYTYLDFNNLEKLRHSVESFEDYFNRFYFKDNPKYIQQYTGLKDKNGIEIYEGDIVIVEDKPYNKVESEVKWGIKSHGWKLHKLEGDQYKYYSLGNSNKIEIIGNIHNK